MSTGRLLLAELWNEFRQGLGSGIVALIFIGLVAYLLMVLTNAGYLAEMGATEVPRNAPNLVYLMTSGDAFFLFFALAWVFAQPVVRDRVAQLHEVVLTMPVNLRTLLWGRYLGAVGVALLLGMSQVVGFLLAPVLELLGLVPAGSMSSAPWGPLLWSVALFSVPTAAGVGAIYMMAVLRTRSIGGPFAGSALLILFWMIAIVIMMDAGIQPGVATVLDPSGFAEVDRLNKLWTPAQKASILYPVSPAFALNRLVWGVVPVLLLAWVIQRSSREALVLERQAASGKSVVRTMKAAQVAARPARHLYRWSAALLAEIRWQHAQLIAGRLMRVLLPGVVLLGVGAVFVHAINHIEGPFEARPEVIAPPLAKSLYLVIAFIAAGAVGMVMRRDHRSGFQEMLDATPAPVGVTLLGRVSVAGTLTVLLALAPAVSVLLVSAVMTPHAFSLATPLVYQLAVYGPGLLELVVVSILVHALIRRSGLAYAASMLITFILIVNHEAELIDYPPYEFGIPAHLTYSVLAGWSVWAQRMLIGDAYKLLIVIALVAVAIVVIPRGLDSRLTRGARALRARLAGWPGTTLAAALAGAVALMQIQTVRFRQQGLYQTRGEQLAERADWERRWVAGAAPFAVAGGEVSLAVDTVAARATGTWVIRGVRSDNGVLHAELPHWLQTQSLFVDGQPAMVDIHNEHVAIKLGACANAGCTVEWRYTVVPEGWSSEGHPNGLSRAGAWLQAADLLPRLGLDPRRLVAAPADRRAESLPEQRPIVLPLAAVAVRGAAPAANWRVRVDVDAARHLDTHVEGPLDFVVAASRSYQRVQVGNMTVLADRTRKAQADEIAQDALAMQQCVARRLGMATSLQTIAQRAAGTGESVHAGATLLLAEEPHWNIAGTGTGRWQRQAAIARALARSLIDDTADARVGSGVRTVAQGVAGAVALACVAEHNGLDGLQQLLSRTSERVSQGMAGAVAPITTLDGDPEGEWVQHYTSAAAFTWVAQADATTLQKLMQSLKEQADARRALTRVLGARIAETVLGSPLSSDLGVHTGGVTVKRQRWSRGGWGSAEAAVGSTLTVRSGNGKLAFQASAAELPEADALLLDDAPSWERAPEDNRVTARK